MMLEDPKAWNQTDVVTDENWANVTKLEPSETYDFRVVAVSGLDKAEQSRSDVWTVFIGPKQGQFINNHQWLILTFYTLA